MQVKDYHFVKDLRNTINFTVIYKKEYIKGDFRYLTSLFILFFAQLFIIFSIGAMIIHKQITFLDIDIRGIEDPYLSGIIFTKIFGVIFSDIMLLALIACLFLLLLYSISQITYSKTNFTFQVRSGSNTRYKNCLISGRKRFLLFVGFTFSLILLVVLYLIITYLIRMAFLSLKILNGPNPALSLFSIIPISVIPFIIVGFLVLPLQLYPFEILHENKGFLRDIKEIYRLFSSWQLKTNFLIDFGIFSFFGYLVVGFLFILVSVFFTFIEGISSGSLLISLLFFTFICTLYFVSAVELGTSFIGNLYGHIYFDVVTQKRP